MKNLFTGEPIFAENVKSPLKIVFFKVPNVKATYLPRLFSVLMHRIYGKEAFHGTITFMHCQFVEVLRLLTVYSFSLNIHR